MPDRSSGEAIEQRITESALIKRNLHVTLRVPASLGQRITALIAHVRDHEEVGQMQGGARTADVLRLALLHGIEVLEARAEMEKMRNGGAR